MFIRNCPKCNIEIIYKQKSHYTRAVKINSLCISCSRSKKTSEIKTRQIFYRWCPVCQEKICHLNRGSRDYSEKHELPCISCKSKKGIRSEETFKKLSDSKIGEKNSFYGKKHSEETKKNISLQKQGKNWSEEQHLKAKNRIISEETKKRLSIAGKNKKPSAETRQKMRESGLKRWNSLGTKYKWARGPLKTWMKEIIKRDNYKCCLCYSKKNLVAHHIYFKSRFPEDAFKIENGITLCKECHILLHKGIKIYEQARQGYHIGGSMTV